MRVVFYKETEDKPVFYADKLDFLPRRGDYVFIKNTKYNVREIIHNFDEMAIEITLVEM